MTTVRYLVSDVNKAIEFYEGRLGFQVAQRFGDVFARVEKDDVVLWLSGPETSAARPMPDGEKPVPGGWNRFVIEVDDLEAEVARLRGEGVEFRNDIVTGPGGSQILAIDGVGNFVELFQPR